MPDRRAGGFQRPERCNDARPVRVLQLARSASAAVMALSTSSGAFVSLRPTKAPLDPREPLALSRGSGSYALRAFQFQTVRHEQLPVAESTVLEFALRRHLQCSARPPTAGWRCLRTARKRLTERLPTPRHRAAVLGVRRRASMASRERLRQTAAPVRCSAQRSQSNPRGSARSRFALSLHSGLT